MTTARQTDGVIRALAAQAGEPRSGPSYDSALILGVALSLLSAIALTLLLFGGPSASFEAVLMSAPFQFKAASMLSLAVGGVFLARFAGRPGSSALAFAALAPAVALLLLGAATDVSGLPLRGASAISVPSCVTSIIGLSLPGLAMMLWAMRRGVPTRPAFAGAVAGLLASAIGGATYALVCKNDGSLFVALWYTAAIAVVTGFGALIGRKALAW
jgi:hypothetical protein